MGPRSIPSSGGAYHMSVFQAPSATCALTRGCRGKARGNARPLRRVAVRPTGRLLGDALMGRGWLSGSARSVHLDGERAALWSPHAIIPLAQRQLTVPRSNAKNEPPQRHHTRATSFRNAGRHPLGMPGRLRRNHSCGPGHRRCFHDHDSEREKRPRIQASNAHSIARKAG
jgi:hypothetical protein